MGYYAVAVERARALPAATGWLVESVS